MNQTPLSDVLEVILVTYNRARYLETSLQILVKSPVAGCRFTIIDNASSDDTPEVCARFAKQFPNFHVRRNRFNVGISGNYLRALETAQAEYTWILCDDDDYDFSNWSEVEQAILSRKFDLLSLGVPVHDELPRGREIHLQDLIQDRSTNFFYTSSFIPCTIFRTSIIAPAMVLQGYYNIHTIYSNLYFFVDAVRKNRFCYITKHDFIINRQENVGYRPLHLVIGWLMVSNTVSREDKTVGRAMLHEMLGGPFYPKKIAQYTLFQRGFANQHTGRDAWRLAIESFRAGPVWFLKVFPFLVILCLPSALSRWLWRQAEKMVERKEGRKVKRPSNVEFAPGKEYRG